MALNKNKPTSANSPLNRDRRDVLNSSKDKRKSTKEHVLPRRFNVNLISIVFFGGLIAVLSLFTFQLVMQGVYGSFGLSSMFSTSTIFDAFRDKSKIQIGVLNSKYTENRLPEGSTWLSDNINIWKRFLGVNKKEYEIISDIDIEQGNHYKYSLLVLPGSHSLSDNEMVNIKKFLDRGGSVFATGGMGSYSADGKWRGWQFISELFGVKFIRDIKHFGENSEIHTLRGNLPLTANVPTGFPLKIATWDRPIAVEVLEPRTTQASFWYNYRRDSGLVKEEVQKSAGIIYGTYGKGRFVWMGFELNAVIGQQEDFIVFDRLFKNSIDWLTYTDIGFVKDWPGNFQAAAIIVPTLTEDVDNVRNVFSLLRRERIKASFLLEPDLVTQRPELVAEMLSLGDLGAIADIGYMNSVNDTSSRLNDLNTQLSTVSSLIRLKTKENSRIFSGIIPKYGLFDDNTITSLARNGLFYVFTDSLTDRSVPRLVIKGNRPVISITKTARDDYEIIRDLGLYQPEFQLYTYREDIERLIFEGGLYVLKIHTDQQLRGEYVRVLDDVVQFMKSKNIWVANATEIFEWWRRKNKIEMRTEERSSTRLAVTVSNPGDEYLEEFLVTVNIQKPISNIKISAEIIGTEIPRYQYDPASKVLYLFIKNLRPNQSRIYYIDFNRVTS